MDTQPVAPIDLLLEVQTLSKGGSSLLGYTLTSPSHRGPHRIRAESPPFGLGRQERRKFLYGDLCKLLQGQYTGSQKWVSQAIESKLRRIGKYLYDRLIPEPIRIVLNETHDPGPLSLMIESDETDIPWEILHTEGASAEFLCLKYRLSRWIPGARYLNRRMPISTAFCAEAGNVEQPEIPRQKPAPLPGTKAEIDTIRKANKKLGVATDVLQDAWRNQILEHLEERDFQLFHFAGHADAREGSPDTSILHLNGGWIEVQDLVDPIPVRLKTNHPFIFLNACSTGFQDQAITGNGGWPHRFLGSCGCSGFLGPTWPIKSEAALTFARSFYHHAQNHETLGEAVRLARQSSPRTPSFSRASLDCRLLSYRLYGHPNARFEWNPAASRKQEPLAEEKAIGSTSSPGQGEPGRQEELRMENPYFLESAADFTPEEEPWTLPSEDKKGRHTISGSATVHKGMIGDNHGTITFNETPDPAKRIENESKSLEKLGLEQMNRGELKLAARNLQKAIQTSANPEEMYFPLAICRLANRHPCQLKISEIRSLEQILVRSISLQKSPSAASLLLAFIKHEYYRLKGAPSNPPHPEELIEIATKQPIGNKQKTKLLELTRIKEFLERIEQGDIR